MISLLISIDSKQDQVEFKDWEELDNFLRKTIIDDKESYFVFCNLDKGTDFDENPVHIFHTGLSLLAYIDFLIECTNVDFFDSESQQLHIHRFDSSQELLQFLSVCYN